MVDCSIELDFIIFPFQGHFWTPILLVYLNTALLRIWLAFSFDSGLMLVFSFQSIISKSPTWHFGNEPRTNPSVSHTASWAFLKLSYGWSFLALFKKPSSFGFFNDITFQVGFWCQRIRSSLVFGPVRIWLLLCLLSLAHSWLYQPMEDCHMLVWY